MPIFINLCWIQFFWGGWGGGGGGNINVHIINWNSYNLVLFFSITSLPYEIN